MKVKRILLTIAFVILFIAGCTLKTTQNESVNENINTTADTTNKKLKVGMVLLGNSGDGYSYAYIDGINHAFVVNQLDVLEDLIFKYNVPETSAAYDACVDLVKQGCNLIVTNSYGHQTYCEQAAKEYPDVEFIAMAGISARKANLKNFHNAFANMYEGRYLAGIVAGMKIKELVDKNLITEKNKDEKGNIKLGYLAAFPIAEVISGYTSFYLGAKSIVPNIVLNVSYMNSWSNQSLEYNTAKDFINSGCVVIAHHTDTLGAPTAVEEAKLSGIECYDISNNIDMSKVAPNSALTSPTYNWRNYFKYVLENLSKGNSFDQDWLAGINTDSVSIAPLTKNCADGSKEAVDAARKKLKSGELHVFDINTFTIDGKKVNSAYATDTDGDSVNDSDEAIFDGYYHESYFRSAPTFNLKIDGINVLN